MVWCGSGDNGGGDSGSGDSGGGDSGGSSSDSSSSNCCRVMRLCRWGVDGRRNGGRFQGRELGLV